MTPTWRTGTVRLRPGFTVLAADGTETDRVDADFAVEGGYLHIRVPGTDLVQVVGAPAVEHASYPAEPADAPG